MPPVQTETMTSVGQYITRVEQLMAGSAADRLWFRGCSTTEHTLVPSLYRRRGMSATRLIQIETQMLSAFQDRSMPYRVERLAEPWETLFVMQHYGVPTRLLDWSENALVGLYFAVSQAEATGFQSDAALWILDPVAWNDAALPPSAPGDRGILSRTAPSLAAYAPAQPVTSMHDRPPVAIVGMHNSPRIVAQRGTFTVFSVDSRPLEAIFETGTFPAAALIRFLLPRADLPGLRTSLDGLGFAESMIYPDLEGLARELKRQYGF